VAELLNAFAKMSSRGVWNWLRKPGKSASSRTPFHLRTLPADDHGLNVGAVHQRHYRAGHLVDRPHIDAGGVEDE
jgi:hypothetical protein